MEESVSFKLRESAEHLNSPSLSLKELLEYRWTWAADKVCPTAGGFDEDNKNGNTKFLSGI